ncbi:MAG: uroporphyrinogen-III C-methyltransferase [Planctomycetota bacterium]
MKYGKVYLVGAGPGDSRLITVGAVELIKAADCIIYDGLVNTALLNYAAGAAELISVRKRTGSKPCNQQTINELIVEKASEGKTVVRLKGGDPGMFGRAHEEAARCADAGIDFEIIPGITAGLGAADYCGIFLSDREHTSQVIFVTGHEATGKEGTNIDFQLLAGFEGSIVFYMGVGNLAKIVAKLIDKGKAANTPTAVVENATLPSQRLVKAPLESIADECERQRVKAPAIIMIGPAADSQERFNWFMRQPLFGQTIVVTRDERGNAAFADKILARGGNVVRFDSIRFCDLTDQAKIAQVLNSVSDYDWIIFTSVNGIGATFGALKKMGKDARCFAKARIACIGSATAARLEEFGIKPDFVPDVYTSAELAKQLAEFTILENKKVALLRSAAAPKNLAEQLAASGAAVDDIGVYTVETQEQDTSGLIGQIEAGEINWITLTSPSTAKAFFGQVQPELIAECKVKVASIGPVTSEQLKILGVNVNAQARTHTIDGLIDTLMKESK